MSCACGYADECDGEHGVLYPLQDGGMCSVVSCKQPQQTQTTGCYPGCFYYTDSCFRKDCKVKGDCYN